MRKKIVATLGAVLVPCLLHAEDRPMDRPSGEISIERWGFSLDTESLGGWKAGLASGGKKTQWLLEGDVAADNGWTLRGDKAAVVLTGARWRAGLDKNGRAPRLRPYGQLMVGAIVSPIVWPVFAAGVGVDVKLQERVALRVAGDALGTIAPVVVPRVSAGLVFSIGGGSLASRRARP